MVDTIKAAHLLELWAGSSSRKPLLNWVQRSGPTSLTTAFPKVDPLFSVHSRDNHNCVLNSNSQLLPNGHLTKVSKSTLCHGDAQWRGRRLYPKKDTDCAGGRGRGYISKQALCHGLVCRQQSRTFCAMPRQKEGEIARLQTSPLFVVLCTIAFRNTMHFGEGVKLKKIERSERRCN